MTVKKQINVEIVTQTEFQQLRNEIPQSFTQYWSFEVISILQGYLLDSKSGCCCEKWQLQNEWDLRGSFHKTIIENELLHYVGSINIVKDLENYQYCWSLLLSFIISSLTLPNQSTKRPDKAHWIPVCKPLEGNMYSVNN